MNSPILALAALSVAVSSTLALDIPSNVLPSTELDKAKADATAHKKPIAFVESNRKSTCPYTIGGTTDAMKEFHSKAVMVFVDTTENTTLPANVQAALATVKSFPRTVIMDATLTNVLATAAYSRDAAEQQKIFREATKKLHEGAQAGASASVSGGSDSFADNFHKPAR